MTEKILKNKADEIYELLSSADDDFIVEFFRPNGENDYSKFYYWQRWFFPQFFKYVDAPFHEEIDCDLVDLFALKYHELSLFGARDNAKTSKVKLATVYATLYQLYDYGIVSSKDKSNSRGFVTDIYNMLISPRVVATYGNVFSRRAREATKRQQTMSVFTTRHGVRLQAWSALQSIRGAVEQERRPDLYIADDFENAKTLDSLVETEKIWKYRLEAIDGMAQARRKIINLGNYISEAGNVHKIIQEKSGRVRILPIEKDGVILWWDKYVATDEEAEKINKTRPKDRWVISLETLKKRESYEQEYLCEPKKIGDTAFKRRLLVRAYEPMEYRETTSGLRVYKKAIKGHRYGIGADTSEGVGRDSQTAQIIDFSVYPFEQVAVFKNNRIDGTDFGKLLCEWGRYYNMAIIAPERNNTGHEVLGVLKQEYDGEIYRMRTLDEARDRALKKLGWVTTASSKAKLVGDFRQILLDGGILLHDADTLDELYRYTDKDVTSATPLPTRHFDLVMALLIAMQLRDEDTGLPLVA